MRMACQPTEYVIDISTALLSIAQMHFSLLLHARSSFYRVMLLQSAVYKHIATVPFFPYPPVYHTCCLRCFFVPDESTWIWLYCVEWTQYSIRLEAVRYTCIRRCLEKCHVPAIEWCARYLSCYLFLVYNSVCFSSVSVSQAQAAQRRTGLLNFEHRTLPKICVGTYIVRSIQPRGTILNWF